MKRWIGLAWSIPNSVGGLLLLLQRLQPSILAVATFPIERRSRSRQQEQLHQQEARPDQPTVLIHSALVHSYQPWLKLWYLCRGLDFKGKGHVCIELSHVCNYLGVAKSTVYEWLRTGKEFCGFRSYSIRKKYLFIYLGSLHRVCFRLGIRDLGTVAEIGIYLISQNFKHHATAATTQQMQDQSRYTAWRSLNKKERTFYKLPTANQILDEGKKSSDKPGRGEIPCLIWVGKRRAFVSKGFVPFGISQQAIADRLGISARSVRRHLTALAVERRQLCQTKFEYTLIQYGTGLNNDGEINCNTRYRLLSEDWMFPDDRIKLYEPNGVTSARREGGHVLERRRFFNYRGKTWLYRCNLYRLDYHLKSQKRRRDSLAAIFEQNKARFGGGIDM